MLKTAPWRAWWHSAKYAGLIPEFVLDVRRDARQGRWSVPRGEGNHARLIGIILPIASLVRGGAAISGGVLACCLRLFWGSALACSISR